MRYHSSYADMRFTGDFAAPQALREYAAGKAGGKLAGSGRLPGKAEPMFVGPSRPRTAAARALLAGTTLHPVVRLGWKPLCEVHCNGCAAAPAYDGFAPPELSSRGKQPLTTLPTPHTCRGSHEVQDP